MQHGDTGAGQMGDPGQIDGQGLGSATGAALQLGVQPVAAGGRVGVGEQITAAFDQAQAQTASDVVKVDVAPLRFSDVGGIGALHAAARSGPPIQLLRARPILRKIVELVDHTGAHLTYQADRRNDLD